ncbi:drug resistance transporter, EmrB/QacA subfamily [Chitinophaga eiseniae]|uniref:Drug resistance transporter, EmrB/QacA subfamily n=1 Tax=Chitinophaga eiseniae TaxID=634771 RepID=A0A1T4U3K2_9BACT|nr:MFS transporter [Chitinophaga eiseniae]SKA47098.1 drug resistance transporter, EmrB/QacA subfamily [Chitinophaga eiseniae]
MIITTSTINRWYALLIVLTAPMLYVIDIFIINIAIPVIKGSLHATDGEVQLVIAAYLLGSACFLITGGRAGDYLGKKKVFFLGMGWFTLASCICGLAQTPLQLNIARFFQGVSSAFMVTQSIALIQVLFPVAAERAKAIGWYGITLSIAAIIGQMLGGYLAETHGVIEGWRLTFFINLPVGVAAMWAIHRYLPETERTVGVKFDYAGAVVLTGALGCLIYAITEGREQHWPVWSFILLALFAVLSLVFLRIQQVKQADKSALINLRLFKQPAFNIGLLAVLFHFMLHTAYLLMMAVYLQNGLGLSALACGAGFIPHALLFMLSSVVASRLLVKYGKKVLLAGLLMIFVSFVIQFLGVGDAAGTISLIALYGLGNGMVLPFLLNIVLDKVPVEDAGAASGIFSTFQQTASGLGISIIGGVFFAALASDIHPNAYTEALQYGLAAGMVCLLVVAVMLCCLPENRTGNRP